jgi:hypothetical protein
LLRPNAAHHAPAYKLEVDDMICVAGRVHALVRPPMCASLKPPRIRLARSGDLTTPITRRPARLLLMTSFVTAVGCIGLFGGDTSLG